MIKEFSKVTINELGYYVYVYSDPDTRQPFYVGKGKDNRVFAHLSDSKENEKVRKIKEITDRGKEPVIEILAHGLDEETALKVEAAAIDLIGIENLTNKQRGHESSVYGKIEVSALNARYNREEMAVGDFTDNVMLIRINQLYRNDMSPFELYEATRGHWRVNIDNAKSVDYVIPVYFGMMLEVYSVIDWYPALSSFMERLDAEEMERIDRNRYEFIGNIASDEIRKKYVNKSVSGLFVQGNSNPIMYINNGQVSNSEE